jgi:hypothetical protein
MTAGEILDVAFGIYRRHLSTLITISVLLIALPLLLFGAGIGAMTPAMYGNPASLLGTLLLMLCVYLVLAQFAMGASVLVIGEGYLGRPFTAGEAIRRTVPKLGALVATALLVGLLAFLGFMLLVIPGIILSCGLVVTTQVVMLEAPGGATAAMGRAWSLTRGFRWRMFLLLLVSFVLTFVVVIGVNVLVEVVFGLLGASVRAGQSPGLTATLAGQAVQLIANTVVTPLPYCILTVAYYDLRVRKEAFDLDLLAGSLQPA